MQTLTYALSRDGSYVRQQLTQSFPTETFTVQTGENIVVVEASDAVPASSINAIVQTAIVPTWRGHPVRNGDELDGAIDAEIALTGKTKEQFTELAVHIMWLKRELYPEEDMSAEAQAARAQADALKATVNPLYGAIAAILTEAETFRQSMGWG